MYRNLVTDGLTVLTNLPAPNAYDVELDTVITVQLNADINPKSAIGNFTLVEDIEWSFKSVDQLKDRDKFQVVKGSLSYEDRRLTFTPSSALKGNARYVLVLKQGGLKSIDGSILGADYVSTFCTITDSERPKATIFSPLYGERATKVPLFRWENQASPSYLFSISTTPDFSVIVHETVISREAGEAYAECSYQPDTLLRDGLYYARVRAINGSYSDPHQFYVQAHEKALVTEADFDDSVYYDDFINDQPSNIECIQSFPKEGASNVKTNTTLCYLVLQGLVRSEDIDWQETYVEGLLFDEEDMETPEHGMVEGEWQLIYDEQRDVTYALFDLTSTEEPDDEIDTTQMLHVLCKYDDGEVVYE